MSFLCFLLCFSLAMPNDVTPLIKGELLQKTLPQGAVHRYKVDLPPNHFWVAVVHQLGADVVVDVVNAAGEQVASVDAPTGAIGPEWLAMESGAGGSWQLTVRHYDDSSEAGDYSILFKAVTPEESSREGKIAQIMAVWNDLESPGAAIAVKYRGKLIYSKGFGSANLEYGIPIDTDTPFHVASVSKQFTAFAIALLDNQGILSLNDDVRKHLPELPDFGTPITLRQLIDHTSGLRDQWDLLILAGWVPDDVITEDDIMSLVKRQRDLNFPPGSEMVYCNTGYTLLAMVVERTTGQSFKDWTQTNIFQPLGMKDSHFHDDHRHLVPKRAYSYNYQGNGFRKSVLNYANVGATSLFTTAENLLLWSESFASKSLGNETLYKQVHQRAKLNDGSLTNYAFGQFISSYRGLPMVQHSGADAGFRAFLARFPEQEFSVAVCANLGSFDPVGIAYKITNIYLEDALEPQPHSPSKEIQNQGMALSEESLSAYAGDYDLNGRLLRLTVVGQGLQGSLRGRRIHLEPLSGERFKINTQQDPITFIWDEKGKITGFKGSERTSKRVTRFSPDPQALQAYVGRYYSEEVATGMSLITKGNHLVAQHPRHGQVTLTPGLQDQFTGVSSWLNELSFVRSSNGAIEELLLSTGRVRRMRYKALDKVP